MLNERLATPAVDASDLLYLQAAPPVR